MQYEAVVLLYLNQLTNDHLQQLKDSIRLIHTDYFTNTCRLITGLYERDQNELVECVIELASDFKIIQHVFQRVSAEPETLATMTLYLLKNCQPTTSVVWYMLTNPHSPVFRATIKQDPYFKSNHINLLGREVIFASFTAIGLISDMVRAFIQGLTHRFTTENDTGLQSLAH